MPESLQQLGFILACLSIPIVWGWLVNWLFSRFSRRRRTHGDVPATNGSPSEDSEFLDYSI